MSAEKLPAKPDASAPEPEPDAPSFPFAWQPLTPRGVAAFARASVGRLLIVELIVALLASGSMVWLLRQDFAPAIEQAVHSMPDGARIKDGQFVGLSDNVLAQTKFLAIAVTPDNSAEIGQSADIQVQFRPADYRVDCVFHPNWGLEFAYQKWNYDLSRASLEPLWGAWRPVVLALCGVAMMMGLGVSWTLLAFIYAGPAWLGAWFANRDLSLAGAWKISGASLMSGALLMALGLILYGLQAVDLIGLAGFFLGHFVLGWIVLICAISRLDRAAGPTAKNPFKSARSSAN